jgi:hypothetical protein
MSMSKSHTHHTYWPSLFAMSVWQRLLLVALALLPLWGLIYWALGAEA